MKDRIDTEAYRVKKGVKIHLKEWPTRYDQEIEKGFVKETLFPDVLSEMVELQEKLYAENRRGLIVVLQAMDAAGKDGAVNHVFSRLNPSGVRVAAFKQPSAEEKDHDYMWRINKALPARGEIGIFNRSHYEDVIVTRVHGMLKNMDLPKEFVDREIWEERYEQIRNWEKYLTQNGFEIIKIFLHVSKEEQRKRLVDRIINKQKNWKFSLSDITERQYWDKYQDIYEEIFEETSTDRAPWYIIPADNKWYARCVIALIVRDTLRRMDPKFPALPPEAEEKLEQFKKLIQRIDPKEIEKMKKALE